MSLETTMKVRPNPWGINPRVLVSDEKAQKLPSFVNIDARGRPGCVVMKSPASSPGMRRFIGAKVDNQLTVQTGESSEIKARPQVTAFKFGDASPDDPMFLQKLAKAAPVSVPANDELYRNALRNGSLIPADIESAKVAGYAPPTAADMLVLYTKLEALAERVYDAQHIDHSKYADLKKIRNDEWSRLQPEPKVDAAIVAKTAEASEKMTELVGAADQALAVLGTPAPTETNTTAPEALKAEKGKNK